MSVARDEIFSGTFSFLAKIFKGDAAPNLGMVEYAMSTAVVGSD